MRWLLGFLVLLVLSLGVLATPGQYEGPILVLGTPTHGITFTDVVGLAVLAPGWLGWAAGVWRRRGTVEAAISAAPRAGVISAFVGGLGAGLVIAGVRPSLLWLGLGTVVLAVVACAVPIAFRRRRAHIGDLPGER
jgi:hypothetical protein